MLGAVQTLRKTRPLAQRAYDLIYNEAHGYSWAKKAVSGQPKLVVNLGQMQ